MTPGLLPVFAAALPDKVFINVDFPTFGIPTIIALIGLFLIPRFRFLAIIASELFNIASLTCFVKFFILELTLTALIP